MNRKFRVWREFTKEYITDGDYFADGAGITLDGKFSICSQSYFGYTKEKDLEYRLEQWTGLTDINGQEIYEGDFVAVYPENYQKTQIAPDIYEIHQDKPLPLKDIVIYKGKVVWEASEFRILVDKNENGVSSVGMKGYWLEVIKD